MGGVRRVSMEWCEESERWWCEESESGVGGTSGWSRDGALPVQ